MKVATVSKHKTANMDDGLIPLINIVFLMLIFFMVAGHIEASDTIKVNAPTSVSEVKQASESFEIIIGLNKQISAAESMVSLSELSALIASKFDESENSEDFQVLVKVDASLPVESLQDVLKIIKSSGIKKITLATQLSVSAI